MRNERLFHTPIGLSTKAPLEMPAVDRPALMREAARIARAARPFMASPREALRYGLRTAWTGAYVKRSIAVLNAQVKPHTLSARAIATSRWATRRCGASFT